MFEHKPDALGDSQHEIINLLHRYIEQNLHRDLSLTHLASIVYLNRSYLSRLYKQRTGVSLSVYITEARITMAKHLLTETEHRIQDIVLCIGFESSSYFAHFFKRITGMTPLEYRNKKRRHVL